MAFMLSDEEARALRRALDNYLPELAYEVARVDRERDRHEFAQFEQVLIRMRQRLADELQEGAPAAPM